MKRAFVCVVLFWSCAKQEQPAAKTDSTVSAQGAAGGAAVEILAPADGDSVTLPLTVRLDARGVEVVAATGVAESGKGHHHLVLDGDAPPDNAPLPQPPAAIHLGNGATERVVDSLPPGPHRIIAIFAGGDHVPMTSVRRDTVTFVVRAKP